MPDDYKVQSIYRYSRKSYKKDHETQENGVSSRINETSIEVSPGRNEGTAEGTLSSTIGCNCDIDPESEIANILHKKCPVITLAQQQLHKLLVETDILLCDNTRCCRSLNDFFYIFKHMLLNQNKIQCILIMLIALAFFTGVLLGAASCGSYLGRFNSPLLTCIDNFFIPNYYSTVKDTYLSIT